MTVFGRKSRMALVAAAAWLTAASAGAASTVWVVELETAIGPASADYFIRTLERADASQVDLLVLRLDTPGGLDKAMRDMVKAILASPVPVAAYVAPSGSRAASAGTYIMYASHVAAMAPATNIGSSTPVSVGGGSPLPWPGTPTPDPEEAPPGERPEERQGDEAAGDPGTPMERKAVNDAVAYIKGLAELRGRNAGWAEATVREAANLTATEALAAGVIDIVAEDIDALLAAVDGRSVTVNGARVAVRTTEPVIERVAPDWRYKLLGVITDPNVAYILLMIGIYGLILEFYNPGIGVGAVVGVICLLLGAFALQMLPLSYAGVALLAVGIGLLVAEAFTPSFGLFGVGGVVAFVAGSIMLFDSDLPAYRVSYTVIVAGAALAVLLLVFALGSAARARRLRAATGKESMIGGVGRVVEEFAGEGRVRAFGEVWRARGADGTTFPKGARVTIVGVDGLRLRVESSAAEPATPSMPPGEENRPWDQ